MKFLLKSIPLGTTHIETRPGGTNAPAGIQPGNRMFHAVAWTGAATWATQFVTWGYMIMAARLLTPVDYGLIGMANIPLGFLTVASEFGVANAVVMLRDLTPHQIAQLNTVAVWCGLGLFAISCMAAHLLGLFFMAPDLPRVVVALSLALVITSFKTVPDAMLRRECRFNVIAKIQAGQTIIYGFALVMSAALGAGYWSFVIGNLVSVTCATLLLLRIARHKFAWPEFQALRHSLVFSTQVFGRRIAWYYNSTIDFIVVGRVLGKAALGSYNLAWTIAEQPQQKFADLITNVVPPYFSKAQHDPAALRRYVLTITEAISLVALPATLGLAIVADDFVAVAFGPKWLDVVVPLKLLALYSGARCLTSFFAPMLNVTGESAFVMWNHIWAAIYFTAALCFASRWGIGAVALVWPLLYPLVAVPLYLRIFKRIELSWATYCGSLRPAVSAVIPMITGLLILRNALPATAGIYSRLGAEVVTGFSIYLMALTLLHRSVLDRLFSALRSART
jgi:O-antigen/teichoic acid export membrane protein